MENLSAMGFSALHFGRSASARASGPRKIQVVHDGLELRTEVRTVAGRHGRWIGKFRRSVIVEAVNEAQRVIQVFIHVELRRTVNMVLYCAPGGVVN